MTEYEDNFNWGKSWLDGPMQTRSCPKKVTQIEPYFQHKRIFPQEEKCNLLSHFTEPGKDDYFLLGNRGEKFYSSIPYKLSKRRVRSACQGDPVHGNLNVPNGYVVFKDIDKCNKSHDTETNIYSGKENNPKENSHNAPMPHEHKKSKKRSHSRDKNKKKPIERWPEIKLDLPSETTRKENSEKFNKNKEASQSNEGISCIHKSKTVHSSVAPNAEPTTEYKRFHSPPPHNLSKQPTFIPAKITSTCGDKNKILYEDIRSIEKNKDCDFQKEKPAIPKNQPIMDELVLDPQKIQSESIHLNNKDKNRFQSEYRANFSSFINLRIADKDEMFDQNLNPYAPTEAKKQIIIQNRERARGMHFSHSHLAQLESPELFRWCPPSSCRSEIVGCKKEKLENRYKNYYLPSAGIHSSPVKLSNFLPNQNWKSKSFKINKVSRKKSSNVKYGLIKHDVTSSFKPPNTLTNQRRYNSISEIPYCLYSRPRSCEILKLNSNRGQDDVISYNLAKPKKSVFGNIHEYTFFPSTSRKITPEKKLFTTECQNLPRYENINYDANRYRINNETLPMNSILKNLSLAEITLQSAKRQQDRILRLQS